jgi:predicted RNA-binding Zn-ribbon protein involved in translation (DUF1610 family)
MLRKRPSTCRGDFGGGCYDLQTISLERRGVAMASYQCPRCGGNVARGASSGAAFGGGAVGALLASAFASFHCAKCGKIKRSEFAPDVRSQMMRGSIGMIVGAIVLLIAVIALIAYFQK